MILEEIGMYEDQPGSVAWEHARRLYYSRHPLGNSVLGTSQSVGDLTRDQMQAYFDRRYAANNIVVSVAGNFDWNRLVNFVGEACASWSTADVRPRQPDRMDRHAGPARPVARQGPAGIRPHADGRAARRLADCVTPPTRWPSLSATTPAAGSTGGWSIPGWRTPPTAATTRTTAAGASTSRTVASRTRPRRTSASFAAFWRDVQREGITADELQLAKSKIASRVVRGSERPMGRMQAIAAAWTYTGEYRDVDTELANYDAVTLGDIRNCLDRYPIDHPTTITFGPARKIAGVEGRAV